MYLTGTADVLHMYYGCITWVQHTLTGTKNAFHRVMSERKLNIEFNFRHSTQIVQSNTGTNTFFMIRNSFIRKTCSGKNLDLTYK